MKRSFVLAFMVIALVLTASSAFADREDLSYAGFSVNVPQGWEVNQAEVRDMRDTSVLRNARLVNNNKRDDVVELFLDTKRDTAGTTMRLIDVGRQWCTRLSGMSIPGGDSPTFEEGTGYVMFYYSMDGSNNWARAIVFDNNCELIQAGDNSLNIETRPLDGQYVLARKSASTSLETFFGIVNSMADFRDPTTPAPTPTPDPDSGDKPTPTPTPTPVSSGGGGGGCSAMGTGLFASLMFAVSAMIFRKR